jgi:hypothetical protein
VFYGAVNLLSSIENIFSEAESLFSYFFMAISFVKSSALTIRTCYVIAKYAIHLWDLNVIVQWENKATISYYVDFLFEMAVVLVEFFHYVHMLVSRFAHVSQMPQIKYESDL